MKTEKEGKTLLDTAAERNAKVSPEEAQEQEISYMLAVPADRNALTDLKGMFSRISSIPGLTLLSHNMQETVINLQIEYGGEEYQVFFYPDSFELPELFRVQHIFPDVDIERLQESDAGIAVEMMFGEDSLASYHLQLKLVHALIPEKLAVLDFSSEKILSGRWVAMAAESEIPPAPRYIYTVQAVSGDDNVVWLHSHGLNRCGLPELEILDSTKDTYNNHYTILETAANRMLELEELPEPGEPFYLARLSEDLHLVITLIPWDIAVKRYDGAMLGGADDRSESHNGNTCAVFVYRSQDALDQGDYEPVSIYDDILRENPIYMLTNSETDRMKALALERIDCVRKLLSDEQNTILVKLGLEVDEEYRTESNSKEHIWFELLSLNGDRITAKLTQEPYYISGLHAEDVGTYSLAELTDWLIFTPERRLSPDDAYLIR